MWRPLKCCIVSNKEYNDGRFNSNDDTVKTARKNKNKNRLLIEINGEYH